MSQKSADFVHEYRVNTETFSYSKPNEAQVTHMCYTLDLNMNDRSILASNVLNVKKMHEGAEFVCLDVFDLEIISVRLCGDMTSHVDYCLTQHHPLYGQGLIISLPRAEQCRIIVKYKVSATTPGILWYSRDNGVFLIHSTFYYSMARSVIPCQDTPQVKFSWSGEIMVSKPYLVLMAGILVDNQQMKGHQSFRYEQNIPVCTYHMAFVIGQFQYKDISPISRVWYEPETDLNETFMGHLHQTANILKQMEKIQGPYVWGVCDFFIMREQITRCYPCLSWLSNEAGFDNILNTLARNWLGSMVTCHTWKDFWLHEAYGKFMERKLLATFVYKNKIDAIWQQGLEELKRMLSNIPADQGDGCVTAPYDFTNDTTTIRSEQEMSEDSYPDLMSQGHINTKLLLDTTNFNPNLSITQSRPILAEKGAILFYTLEDICGVIEFEQFLRYIIEKYKYETITTQQLIDDLKKYFFAMKLFAFDFDKWLKCPGNVPVEPQYIDPDKETVELMARVISLNKDDIPLTKIDIKQLSLKQLKYFLNLLLEEKLTCRTMEKLNDLIEIERYKDLELQHLWLRLCVKNNYYIEKTK